MSESFSERAIYSKYITAAIQQAGRDIHKQVREEECLTKGRIIIRGKLRSRGESRRARLHSGPSAQFAKSNKQSVGSSMQQTLSCRSAGCVLCVLQNSNGNRYTFRTMTTPAFRASVCAAITGTATPIINRFKWDKLLISTPHFNNTASLLKSLCDPLKTRLPQARQLNEQLASALVEQAAA